MWIAAALSENPVAKGVFAELAQIAHLGIVALCCLEPGNAADLWVGAARNRLAPAERAESVQVRAEAAESEARPPRVARQLPSGGARPQIAIRGPATAPPMANATSHVPTKTTPARTSAIQGAPVRYSAPLLRAEVPVTGRTVSTFAVAHAKMNVIWVQTAQVRVGVVAVASAQLRHAILLVAEAVRKPAWMARAATCSAQGAAPKFARTPRARANARVEAAT